MTINEYKELHNLDGRELAERLGVSVATAYAWLKGVEARPTNAEALKQLGIEHPMLDMKARRAKERENEIVGEGKNILKYFQIHAVKTYGSTIVSKKHSPEEIINAFAGIGINVKVREYDIPNVCGGDTHYVVERR